MIVTPLEDVIETNGYSKPTKTLTKDKEYVVFATQKDRKGKLEYYLLVDGAEDSFFPEPYSSTIFRVIDSTTPEDWVKGSEGFINKITYMSFPEWANNFSSFYSALVDGPGSERDIFTNKMEEYGFNELRKKQKHEEDLKLSKERGYEHPSAYEATQ